MTAAYQSNRLYKLNDLYESHPSLSAVSLESIDHHTTTTVRPPTMPLLPPHQSGFAEDSSGPEDDSASDAQWSPEVNAFSRAKMPSQNSGWYRHQPYSSASPLKSGSGSRSRFLQGSLSPPNARDDDLTLGMKIPLPTGSMSPDKGYSENTSPAPDGGLGKVASKSVSPVVEKSAEDSKESPSEEKKGNFIRFQFRADVMQRTDAIGNVFSPVRDFFAYIHQARRMTIGFVVIIFAMMIIRLLTPSTPPFPDLIKVAHLAKNFEPMIYYSENGLSHIEELQETGTAVWDLSESMRVANMTSSPLIVSALDTLSESLKSLGAELTTFFACVDGDIDNIIMTMEWGKRELQSLQAQPETSLEAGLMRMHAVFASVGLLSDPNKANGAAPTTLDKIVSKLIANTPAQRTRNTLERAFNEVIQTLEEAINTELQRTITLLALFEAIERQFTNIARLTAREIDTQTRMEDELLSSLWVRIMGSVSGQAPQLRKYEKNKNLLEMVYKRTRANKLLLEEHSGKLKTLQGSLEVLRKRLVGPVVKKAVDEGGVGLKESEKKSSSGKTVNKWEAAGLMGSSCGLDAQIEGLEHSYKYLAHMRQAQRGKYLDKAYGPTSGRERFMIEGRS